MSGIGLPPRNDVAGISSGFPIFDQPFVDENRMITPPWRQLLITFWNRTGRAGGVDSETALLEDILAATGRADPMLSVSSLGELEGPGRGAPGIDMSILSLLGIDNRVQGLEQMLVESWLSVPSPANGQRVSLTGDVTGVGVTTIPTAIPVTVLDAGTYTPTLTNVANVTASTAYALGFIRIRNNVIVFGRVDIQPTVATTFTKLRLSLPFASALSDSAQLAGVASNVNANPLPAVIFGDVANDEAALGYTCTADVSAIGFFFTFGYQILP